jgi:pyruvate dehydrogenase E2 component (dihydrolipoamide acetyltransferase)
MAYIVEIPKLGLTMEKGRITNWHKKAGDYVTKGEIIFELETDKISTEVEAPDDGYILKIIIDEGTEADVHVPACIMGEKGEDVTNLSYTHDNKEVSKSDVKKTKNETVQSKKDDKVEIKISPLARRLAREHGIDYTRISPTGADGRIVKEDIIAAVEEVKTKGVGPKTDSGELSSRRAPLIGIRKIIAQKMYESKRNIPHVYFRTSVDATNIMGLRNQFDDKPSINDIIIKTVAGALVEFPNINVSFTNNEIQYHNHVNIGFAVSVEDGLVVPVIRNASKKSLLEIKKETEELIEKARTAKLLPDDITGGTFTITNLGMYQIDDFIAIINPPESGILAIGRIKDCVYPDNGKIAIRPEMILTLSVDHRTVDGVYAAQFLEKIKNDIENR